MNAKTSGLFTSYSDVWVVDGIRTAFAEFNGVLGDVSPIDLGGGQGIALLVENPQASKQ